MICRHASGYNSPDLPGQFFQTMAGLVEAREMKLRHAIAAIARGIVSAHRRATRTRLAGDGNPSPMMPIDQVLDAARGESEESLRTWQFAENIIGNRGSRDDPGESGPAYAKAWEMANRVAREITSQIPIEEIQSRYKTRTGRPIQDFNDLVRVIYEKFQENAPVPAEGRMVVPNMGGQVDNASGLVARPLREYTTPG
jgi:hypothetical protein